MEITSSVKFQRIRVCIICGISTLEYIYFSGSCPYCNWQGKEQVQAQAESHISSEDHLHVQYFERWGINWDLWGFSGLWNISYSNCFPWESSILVITAYFFPTHCAINTYFPFTQRLKRRPASRMTDTLYFLPTKWMNAFVSVPVCTGV